MGTRHLLVLLSFFVGLTFTASAEKKRAPKKQKKETNKIHKTPFAPIKWTPVEKAVGYVIEIAHDQNFGAPLVKAEVKKALFKWKNPKPGNYFFRIASLSPTGDLSEFSKVKPLLIRYPAPKVKWPHNEEEVHMGKDVPLPLFEWKNVSKIKQHEVVVATDRRFLNVVFKKKTRSFKLKFPQLKPGEYYWRVRALHASGIPSYWTKATQFEVLVNKLSQDWFGRHYGLRPYDPKKNVEWWRHLFGGGHYKNDHWRSGISSNIVTITSFALGLALRSKAADYPASFTDGPYNNGDTTTIRTFETSRRHYYDTHRSDVYFALAGFNFIGSIIDSAILEGRSEKDSTHFVIGSASTMSHSHSRATYTTHSVDVEPSTLVPPSPTNAQSNEQSDLNGYLIPGLTLGFTSGRVVQKEFLLDLGVGVQQVRYRWWWPFKLGTVGVQAEGPIELWAGLGFRYFKYQSQKFTLSRPNEKSRFGLTTGSLMFQVASKSKVSLLDWKDLPISGGVQFSFVDLGTVWEHPTTYVSASGKPDRLLSRRATRRSLFSTFGFRAWAQVRVKSSFLVQLEGEWLTAKEQALQWRSDPVTKTPEFTLVVLMWRLLYNF